MNTQPTALDAYLARAAAIHVKLAWLQQLADDHIGHDPDAIHWGHACRRRPRADRRRLHGHRPTAACNAG
jgi:hypothetical protein